MGRQDGLSMNSTLSNAWEMFSSPALNALNTNLVQCSPQLCKEKFYPCFSG